MRANLHPIPPLGGPGWASHLSPGMKNRAWDGEEGERTGEAGHRGAWLKSLTRPPRPHTRGENHD